MVAMISEDRNNESLFEKSMKVAVNIMKLSSFSIAKKSLGAAGPYPVTKNLPTVTSSVMVANETQLTQPPSSQKSENPKNSSKPRSFLKDPSGGNKSSYVVHGDKKSHIDGEASAYIEKVHQRNLSDLSESSNLPPPPRAVV